MKHVLVTGATGFVGRHLVQALLERGCRCRLLVRSPERAADLAGHAGVELQQGDVTVPASLRGVGEGVDTVFHLAAEGHVAAVSEASRARFHAVNVQGTCNLIAALGSGPGPKRLIHFSSTAAMGLVRKAVVAEDDPPQPRTPYQICKRESEIAALETGAAAGLEVVVLRPCMIYGPGGKGEFFKICRWMRRGIFPRVGLGANLTPLVHVRDVVQGALKAAEQGRPGETYLICGARSVPMEELRSLVAEAWGCPVRRFYVPRWAMFAAAWGVEVLSALTGAIPPATRQNIRNTVASRVFSVRKASEELGYAPEVEPRDGIRETVAWYQEVEAERQASTQCSR